MLWEPHGYWLAGHGSFNWFTNSDGNENWIIIAHL